MADAARQTIPDPYETACDEAIAACNGDLRSTIRALLIVNEFLEHELQESRATTAQGGGWVAA
ncbi:MAG: hypothetical protein JWP21_2774 [Tardiphaga sp.]|jgi:hypothetical protein|nr:hypothetical protein [Tardiphaga sp.]